MKSQSPSTARRQGTRQTDAAHAEQPPHNALPRAAAAPPPRAAAAHTCSPRVSYVLSLRALHWSTASEDVLSGPITLLNHAQPDRCPTTADRRIGTAPNRAYASRPGRIRARVVVDHVAKIGGLDRGSEHKRGVGPCGGRSKQLTAERAARTCACTGEPNPRCGDTAGSAAFSGSV